MNDKISIYGAGRTGIQLAVYLLKELHIPIMLYDKNNSYAQGISLDVMQSTVLEHSNTLLKTTQNINEISPSKILIISENASGIVDLEWIPIAKKSSLTIVATQDTVAIKEAINAGVHKDSIIGIHGIADADILCSSVAQTLGVVLSDIQAMVYGPIGKNFNTKPEYVRANGIPIDEIQIGSFDTSVQKAKEILANMSEDTWKQYYRLSAASFLLIRLLLSNQSVLIPATSTDTTIPALVDTSGVIHWYSNLV